MKKQHRSEHKESTRSKSTPKKSAAKKEQSKKETGDEERVEEEPETTESQLEQTGVPELTDYQKAAFKKKYPTINDDDLNRPMVEINRHIATKMNVTEAEAAKIVGIIAAMTPEECE